MEERIKTAVITPSELLSAGLRALLSRSEFAVTEYSSGIPSETGADIVIMDVSLPDCSPVFALGVPVVALASAAYAQETLSGYSGVISIYDSQKTVLRTLRKAAESEGDESLQAEGGELSPREKEILVCIAKGMLNKEIAYKYNLSIFTVMTHRKNITAKTGIKSIAGLTAYAILQGLIDIESIK